MNPSPPLPPPSHNQFIASLRDAACPAPLVKIIASSMGMAKLPHLLHEYAETSNAPKINLYGTTGIYITRYMLDDGPSGRTYLHQFHRPDEDREYHDHPWPFTAFIIVGSYVETRVKEESTSITSLSEERSAGTSYTITASEWHRIESLCNGDPVWTLVRTGPKEKSWSFFDSTSGRKTPWREFIRLKALDGAE